MSPYDPHEDPIPITTLQPSRACFPNPVSPKNKPLQTCYAKGINKASDTDADTPGIQSSSSLLLYHFNRHGLTLSRDGHQVENVVPRGFFVEPVFDDSSWTRPAEGERNQNTETEASQKQGDDVRITAHADRRAREKAILHAWECDHAAEPFAKSQMRDGS
jgi:hypothetical protein